MLALALVGAGALPGVFAPAVAAPVSASARPAFAADLARFEAGDATLDARALRFANRARLGGTIPEWAKAGEAWALLPKSPARALAMADAERKVDPLSLNALTLQEEALQRLGRRAEAQVRHRQILILLRAITGGTDGATRDRAWNVVSVAEKDTALALLGYLVTGERIERAGNHVWALVSARAPVGQGASTIWISIDGLVPASA